jgi:hypothetical protein
MGNSMSDWIEILSSELRWSLEIEAKVGLGSGIGTLLE